MAERIVSPGVFTNENDLSFLPQGIGEIGAAIIGPTEFGPAFWPTQVTSNNDFNEIFGGDWEDSYLPYAIRSYLDNAGVITVIRILGLSGYDSKVAVIKQGSGSSAICATGSDAFSITAIADGDVFQVTGSTGTKYQFMAMDHPVPPDQPPVYYFPTGSALGASVTNLETQMNAVTTTTGVSVNSGSTGIFELSASTCGDAGNDIDFVSGSTTANLGGGVDATLQRAVAVIHHSWANTAQTFEDGAIAAPASASSFVYTLSSSLDAVSCSLDSANKNFINNIFGTGPKKGTINTTSGDPEVSTDPQDRAYMYMNFKNWAKSDIDASPATSASLEVVDLDLSGSVDGVFRGSVTPWIQSQLAGGVNQKLFRVHHLAHGTDTNTQFKIGIRDVKFASEIAKSEYGSFTLVIRKYDDTDKVPTVVETYKNCNLNPKSTNYIARLIGDKYYELNSSGKLKVYGDWTNISKFIRVEVDDNVKYAGYDGALVPLGFNSITQPLTGSLVLPAATMISEQVVDSEYNNKVYYGFSFTDITDGADNYHYLKPFPNGADAGANEDFDLGNYTSHPSSSAPDVSLSSSSSPLSARKFIVPMTNGFNGYDPARVVKKGEYISATNSFGYDISTSNADGYLAYKRGLDALSNQDLYDFNMLLLPGVIRSQHSALTQVAMDLCESRGDAFYVMDSSTQDASISSAINTVASIDTSYSATYYPWVKILDTNINLPVWVPPSVVLGGVIAYNDKVSYEWFAPAGLNRGGLTEVLDAYDRVTQSDRDDLYDSSINPIASFPNEGFVVWGQKTLQVKASALDRINVRRLLIAAKKFIASSTRYLVFEQNSSATRNRFLNIVNPYLDSIQQRQGLYSFKVVMDETNNTPDVIDRNEMIGAIYLQPTKTAEFIILDFNILPTGATFPED